LPVNEGPNQFLLPLSFGIGFLALIILLLLKQEVVTGLY